MHASIIRAFRGGLLKPEHVAGKRVIEVGSYDVNGSVRPMLELLEPASYIGVDALAGPRVDRVVDCTELVNTFEHVRDWKSCMTNLAGVLAELGLLVITTRSPGYPYHAHPEDHWRYSRRIMVGILHALDLWVVECYPDPDPTAPGVIAKALKPEGWLPPPNGVLDAPALQPEPIRR